MLKEVSAIAQFNSRSLMLLPRLDDKASKNTVIGDFQKIHYPMLIAKTMRRWFLPLLPPKFWSEETCAQTSLCSSKRWDIFLAGSPWE